ncbi:Protease II [Candidatus Jidaibacter acanthamoeba]|uniref:Protease II n=1 Tax=Candidatus Jidaibacter acanthamoebae TaxID=86105 RepID=A0A0C1QHI3_9RICK|nr:S9 family peptidase [Candidatus Jidaibacter acanthamoeba]KIE04969.1 Protease II [Candidatus Jidaibacter acanthamoeba]
MSLPPVAKKIPYIFEIHSEKLTDDYAWLRDKNWPDVKDEEVLNYLKEENKYFESIMASQKDMEEAIYKELKNRIKLTDTTYPIKRNEYYYYSRTTEHSNYQIFCRKKNSLDNPEEIILDCDELGKDLCFFDLGAIAISPDHSMLAYSTDTTGGERYNIYVKNLNSNALLRDEISDSIGSIVWHKNGKGFFYTKLNEFWRTDKVYYHELGTSSEQDKLIFKENDQIFRVSISKSKSEQFLIIDSESKDYNEILVLDFNSDNLEPKLIEPRKDNHLYYIEHRDGYFYIKTNSGGKNFRLVKAPLTSPESANWQEVIPHSNENYLTDFFTFKDTIVVQSQHKGLSCLKVYDYDFKNFHKINFPDPSYFISPIFTTFDDVNIRFSYSSLNSPEMIMENSFFDNHIETLKTKEVLGGYDKSYYASERIFAKGKDGVEIPISLVYRKDRFKHDGSNPLYLYGYGSYGYPTHARFRSDIVSLLDRGFVYAIAHIRGGDEMGQEWYLDGKLLNKKNTFDDFIVCAEYLIANNYTRKQNIVIVGGSAGGLLVGVCVNERPDLFKMAVADVPYVDALNTMLDESLPLTPGEYSEWGNPKNEEYYRYIKSYSPYDNIKRQDYPALYVTAGLTDPRVTYWEPAKWVAKLRDYKTDNNLLVLKTNMDAGHCGASGRFEYLKDSAQEYSFILKIFGV